MIGICILNNILLRVGELIFVIQYNVIVFIHKIDKKLYILSFKTLSKQYTIDQSD